MALCLYSATRLVSYGPEEEEEEDDLEEEEEGEEAEAEEEMETEQAVRFPCIASKGASIFLKVKLVSHVWILFRMSCSQQIMMAFKSMRQRRQVSLLLLLLLEFLPSFAYVPDSEISSESL